MMHKLDAVVYCLEHNVAKFLQGMAANHLDAQENAFVDVSGRVIATFFQRSIDGDHWLICVSRFAENAVNKHIAKYARLTKTRYEKWTHQVYVDSDLDRALKPNEHRLTSSWGMLLITDRDDVAIHDEEATRAWRVLNHMPWHGVDYHQEMLLNIHAERYVAFDKGCFLGQEILSRVHFKSKPPKKLIVVYKEDCSEQDQSLITSLGPCLETGQLKGFLFVNNS